MSRLPKSREEILATGVINHDFQEAVTAKQYPSVSCYTVRQLKEINTAMLPWTQEKLERSRPSNITETEHHIILDGHYRSRVLLCYRSNVSPTAKCPIVVLFHGGGHCVGNPESEIPLARRLALQHNAVVVLPSYRQAPENPFPASIKDSWATTQYLAAELAGAHAAGTSFLPPQCDSSRGFIIAGISAGANLAASVAHLARDQKLNPPLTGQVLVAGTYISYKHVPTRYQPYYLSREQNKDAPVLDLALYNTFQDAFKPDHQSPLWAIFDQHHPLDQGSDVDDVQVKHGHMGLPPAYFQICGLDIGRDDSLIYEKVLREECSLETRADLYAGYSHVWWSQFPELQLSKQREDDAVQGFGWLLGFSQQ